MKKNNNIYIIFLLIIIFVYTDKSLALEMAKITIQVVDEQNSPVEKASIGIGFEINTKNGTEENSVDGFSDDDGQFSGSASTNGHIGWTIKKSGYYVTYGFYDFSKKGIFGWEPRNPEIKVVLRKVENPVPMYARNTTEAHLEIPVVGKDIGFDLIAFDWVAPYGNGFVSDFVFFLEKYRGGPQDFEYKLKINFSNTHDGIQSFMEKIEQGSIFKLPRLAPIDGYLKEVRVFIDRNPVGASSSSFDRNKHYVFRVRSEVKDGKLKRAMYGKILGDISITPRKEGTAFINFKYYLNPDYTRNLEFDPKRNLFCNLPDLERVTEP